MAARLCGIAAAGEVLATREVVHLAGRMDGVTFEDRGAARLKNIEDAVGIVRVVPEGDDPSSAFRSAESADERPIRIVLADDSVLFREGVARGDATRSALVWATR